MGRIQLKAIEDGRVRVEGLEHLKRKWRSALSQVSDTACIWKLNHFTLNMPRVAADETPQDSIEYYIVFSTPDGST